MIDFTVEELQVMIEATKLKIASMSSTAEPGTHEETQVVLVTNLLNRLKTELKIRELE